LRRSARRAAEQAGPVGDSLDAAMVTATEIETSEVGPTVEVMMTVASSDGSTCSRPGASGGCPGAHVAAPEQAVGVASGGNTCSKSRGALPLSRLTTLPPLPPLLPIPPLPPLPPPQFDPWESAQVEEARRFYEAAPPDRPPEVEEAHRFYEAVAAPKRPTSAPPVQ
jgi:hypothetical protein